MRKVHLVNIAGADVTLSAIDRINELTARYVGNDSFGQSRTERPRPGLLSAGILDFRVLPAFNLRVSDFVALCQRLFPKRQMFPRAFFASRTVRLQARRDYPRLRQPMVEHYEAVIKAEMTIRQLQVVYCPSRQPRFDKVFQVVS